MIRSSILLTPALPLNILAASNTGDFVRRIIPRTQSLFNAFSVDLLLKPVSLAISLEHFEVPSLKKTNTWF